MPPDPKKLKASPDLQPIWYGYGLARNPTERIRKLGIASDVSPINPIW